MAWQFSKRFRVSGRTRRLRYRRARVADEKRSARLITLGEWAVLGLVASRPQHAFALVKALAPRGELGRIWSVPTPVVYRAVNNLRDDGLIATIGEERSEAGPPKTILTVTPLGESRLQDWLCTPVAHMRDVRGELLLKLALLARLDRSAQTLVAAQLHVFEPLVAALQDQTASSSPRKFDATLASWRLESARAVMRFLKGLVQAGG
jgi:DNA-binding PadR family transcriptional regulator